MMLAITKNNFHYKYYLLLQKLWDIQSIENKQVSLCVYSQFIFWMTILTTVSFPLILIGWFILKLLVEGFLDDISSIMIFHLYY